MNKAKYLNDLLTSFESEDIISNKIQPLTYDIIGSSTFLQQHAYLSKLNMQEVKNILTGGEDLIMTQFIDHEKLIPLIHDIFLMNSFKLTIFPEIKKQIANLSSIKSYLMLYHEAVLCNLLENFLYSITACEAADEYIVDIIEYAYNMISKWINFKMKKNDEEIWEIEKKSNLDMKIVAEKIKNNSKNQEENEKELDQKNIEINFGIAMSCINILRYISDHLEQLAFPVRYHMMNIKDVPILFVTLMEMKPWQRKYYVKDKETNKEKEVIEYYENNNWVEKSSLQHKIPKLEIQIWITIYNLCMSQENNKKYEITEYRQNSLLRLRKFFSTELYDQIPQMNNLYRSLEEMSLMTFPTNPTKNEFIIEMIPKLTNSKEFKLNKEEIDKISKKILKDYFFNLTPEILRKELEPINEIYSIDNMEYFMDDPKCANCGKNATSRCSRCKSEWYCSKECQIKRWKVHKELCKTLSELFKEDEEKKKKKEFNDVKIKKEEKKIEENEKITNKIKIEDVTEKNKNKENDTKEKNDNPEIIQFKIDNNKKEDNNLNDID